MKADIEELKKKVAPIARDYGVKSVYLFGSFARGDADENSDYDVYIEKGKIVGFFKLMSFENALKAALQRSVDIVTSGNDNEKLQYAIRRDRVLLYEA